MLRYLLRIIPEMLWADWQYVGSFDAEKIKMDHPDHYVDQYVPIKIHCFESRWGTRHARITVMRYGPHALLNWIHYSEVKKSVVWQNEVYPWLRGRHVGNIPSYKKVKGGKWDFARMLKGLKFGPKNKDQST